MKSDEFIDKYPLSPLQQGMLFHYLTEPGIGTDIEQIVCTLHEELEVLLLRKAWERIVERYTVLRTAFQWDNTGNPSQVVRRHIELPWQELDWRGLSKQEQEESLSAFLREDRQRGFDMDEVPLFRLTLVSLAKAKYQLVWTFHHALMDGRSFQLVLKEIFSLYESFLYKQELVLKSPRPFRDYIVWLQSQDPSRAESYWRQQLQGFIAPNPLVVDKAPSSQTEATVRQGDQSIFLTEAETTALKTFAYKNELTLNTLVQGAWFILLNRYSGEEDLVFGAVRACRKSTIDGAEEMVGLLINTLPIRASVTPNKLLIELLKQLRVQWIAMRDYEHTPLYYVQKWSEVPADMTLFHSILMFENYQLNSKLRENGRNWANRHFRLYEQTNYPITITAYSGVELCLQIEFDRSRFDTPTITRMLGHLKMILVGMLSGSHQKLRDISILTEKERYQLLVEWNDTNKDYPEALTLPELFKEQVEQTPDAVAVVFEEQQLTYRELNQQANQLAHYLQRIGVGIDTLVGVCMERSLELVVALCGILKAGGAYVPIDPDYPQERVAFMLQDAATQVVLTQRRLVGRLSTDNSRIICLDDDWERIACESTANLAKSNASSNLAYMIYTSGSTGRPKGAMNTHRGICNRVLWMQDQYRLTERDRVLQKTPLSFDVSVWEFFWPLLVGACLVVAKAGGHRDAAYLVRLIREQQITVLHFVPTMLRMFLEDPGVEDCRSLSHVICSGEVLPFDLQEQFFRLLPSQLYNLYGPTEAAVDVTHWTCQRSGDLKIIPIGRPVANTQIYILDRYLQPVPVGVPGELHIGGVQVGRGYHKRPELTVEKFIADPFCGIRNARLYKTGDLCCWLSDGNIEYLGRMDFQVKIRGFRVELGEIETVLGGHPLVKSCVVTVREDVPGDKRLVAYIVWQSAKPFQVDELRNYIKERLPDFMVPSAFVILDEIPMAPNGKADLKRLPAPDRDTSFVLRRKFTEANSSTEQEIAEIWQDVLGVKKLGIDSNFFDLGGDSLRLMRVRSLLQQAFGREIDMIDLFRHTTIRLLAKYLAGHDDQDISFTQNKQDIKVRKDSNQRQQQLRRKVLTRMRNNDE